MAVLINEDATKAVIEIVKKLIEYNKLDEALNILRDKFSTISRTVQDAVILNAGQFHSLNDRKTKMQITSSDAAVEEANIKLRLLDIMDRIIPIEIETQKLLGKIKADLYKVTPAENLERILGPVNHLVKINWLEKGIKASKSVCQVQLSNGKKGTGFILENNYLLTNHHVISTPADAATAKIIFDYEEDLFGNQRTTSEYFLDSTNCKFSDTEQLDYAYIKIKDNPTNPISKWGFLELDTFSDPQVNNPVTIIQHPLGQTKQIALTANKIIGINGHRLLYETDTESGSSGSPVFNNEWKVIALHHAGLTEEDGGLVINPLTGEKRGANEGILIKEIARSIGLI